MLRDGHLLDDELANQISSETHFQAEKESMYYFVREPKIEESFNEGYAEKLVIESELGDGQVCVDGHLKFEVAYGDRIKIDVKPEYRLKCMKFNM